MANSDYSVVGTGQFCPVARLMTGLSPGTTVIGVTDVRMVEPGDVAVGSLIIIGDEIMQIASLGSPTWTVKRGCLDTIPMGHDPGQTIFVIDKFVGSNFVEYLGTQTISVKLQAKAVGGVVPMEYAPPHQITFNQRFARPYPPARMLVNGQPWYIRALIDEDNDLTVSWVGRNKILQGDQILGQQDAGVTEEPTVTYTVRFYTEANVLVKTISGITASPFVYTFEQIVADFNLWSIADTGMYGAWLTLHSAQGSLESLNGYMMPFDLDTNDIITTPGKPTNLQLGAATTLVQPLSWTAPTYIGGAQISDYRIEYSSDQGVTWTQFAHSPSAATNASVGGLTSLTAYQYRVAAVNSYGVGDYSDVISGFFLGTAYDPLYSNVSLLIRGDGADGSSTFIDESQSPVSGIVSVPVTTGGLVRYDASRKKFGTSSINFRENHPDPIAYLKIYEGASIPSKLRPTGDFTLDAWVYVRNNGIFTSLNVLYGITNDLGETVLSIAIGPDSSLVFLVRDSSNNFQGLSTNPMFSGHVVPSDQWVYVAASYKQSTKQVSLWIGAGEPKATVDLSTLGFTGVVIPTSGGVYIGNDGFSNSFWGNLEDLRLTSVLRYSINEFVYPPTRRAPAQ